MRSSPPGAGGSVHEPEPQVRDAKRPDGSFFYVGKAGALRFGKTVTDSMAAPDDFKRRLLAGRPSDRRSERSMPPGHVPGGQPFRRRARGCASKTLSKDVRTGRSTPW